MELLKDDIIGDIISIKIDADMSVSTLYAMETIFYLRLQLAQVSWDKDESIYEELCRDRFEQIFRALIEKYSAAKSIGGKIEILERIEIISQTLYSDHSLFALEEASNLEDEPDLTYAQKLRLKWIPGITPEDESEIVAELLPQTYSSFEMATLALITDFCTDEERSAVFKRYLSLVDAAISSNDIAELGRLLALAAYWNNSPSLRSKLHDLIEKHLIPHSSLLIELTLPEKRVNAIAAAICAKIDAITGKYEDYDYIPA